jgi:hypothetical protein
VVPTTTSVSEDEHLNTYSWSSPSPLTLTQLKPAELGEGRAGNNQGGTGPQEQLGKLKAMFIGAQVSSAKRGCGCKEYFAWKKQGSY